MNMEKDLAGYPRQIAPHLTLRRILGEGGTSVVFEAFHTRLKVPVAVKVLSVSGSVAEQARLRLRREAELYALLDDPRIPRVYDVDELPDGTPYVVMEFVPGGSLESLLMRGPLSQHRAVTITREVLAALVYVHARGVLHRDVKPANVILNEVEDRCQVRLVDFGIAKAAFDEASEEALTQQGTLVGTPHYMAPERLLGHESDALGDIYAVGVMLYEMLTGVVPFGGPTLGEVIASVLRDVPRPLHELCPGILPELEQVVVRAMARDPHARYRSAADMLAALSQVEETLQGDVSSPRIVPPSRPLSTLPPPTLEVMPEDDLLQRTGIRTRRRRSAYKPLLGAAAVALILWTAWPNETRDLRVQKEPELPPAQLQPQEPPAPELAPAEPPSQSATGAFVVTPDPDLPTHPPSAGVLADPLPGEDEAAPADEQPEPPPQAQSEAEQAADSPAPERAPVAEPEPAARAPRTPRKAARARPAPMQSEPSAGHAGSYAPAPARELTPFLEQMDTLLKDPPAPKLEDKPKRSGDAPILPDNPY